MKSDEALAAEAALLKDRAAFAELMRRHQQRIWLFLKRLTGNDAAEAEDLAQETFLQAWRKLHQFKGDGRFGAWLSSLAYRQFLMSLRKSRPEILPELPEVAVTPSLDAGSELDRLLCHVSQEEGVLLTMSYALELTNQEIGDIVGQPVGTVKSRIHRARRKIADAVGADASARKEVACG